jgi:hypothetical protein
MPSLPTAFRNDIHIERSEVEPPRGFVQYRARRLLDNHRFDSLGTQNQSIGPGPGPLKPYLFYTDKLDFIIVWTRS